MERISKIWSASEEWLRKLRSWDSLVSLAQIHDDWNRCSNHWNNSVYIDTEGVNEFYAYLIDEVCQTYMKVIKDLMQSGMNDCKWEVYARLSWEMNQIIHRSEYHDDIHGCPNGRYIGA